VPSRVTKLVARYTELGESLASPLDDPPSSTDTVTESPEQGAVHEFGPGSEDNDSIR